jgi:hypothetical protein
MKFQITQEDIDRGIRSDARKCAGSLCILRTLGWPEQYDPLLTNYVSVSPFHVSIGGGRHLTPDALQDFISRYDKGEPVEPIEFDIAAIPERTT